MITMIESHKVLRSDGAERTVVHLLADPAPASLALTGADVPGMNDDDVLAAGSTLWVPGGGYVLFEDGGTFQ